MNGWARYLALTARAKTGLGSDVVTFAAIAAVAAAAMLLFLTIAAFLWLAERLGAVNAGLLMAGLFLIIGVIATVCCVMARRRIVAQARLELAARSTTTWLDPRLLTIGLQAGRAIGWGRLVSLAAVGILAAGLSKEWLGRNHTSGADDEAPDD